MTTFETIQREIDELEEDNRYIRGYESEKIELACLTGTFNHYREMVDNVYEKREDKEYESESEIEIYESYQGVYDMMVPSVAPEDLDVPTLLHVFKSISTVFDTIFEQFPNKYDGDGESILRSATIEMKCAIDDVLEKYEPLSEFFIKRTQTLMENEKRLLKLRSMAQSENTKGT